MSTECHRRCVSYGVLPACLPACLPSVGVVVYNGLCYLLRAPCVCVRARAILMD